MLRGHRVVFLHAHYYEIKKVPAQSQGLFVSVDPIVLRYLRRRPRRRGAAICVAILKLIIIHDGIVFRDCRPRLHRYPHRSMRGTRGASQEVLSACFVKNYKNDLYMHISIRGRRMLSTAPVIPFFGRWRRKGDACPARLKLTVSQDRHLLCWKQ